jgi:hypothetical protein
MMVWGMRRIGIDFGKKWKKKDSAHVSVIIFHGF